MSRTLAHRYPGPGGMLAVSFVCHLIVFLIISTWYSTPEFHPDTTQVTYVDMVTLPVASPQSGMPAPAAKEEAASAAPPAPPAAPPAMTVPAKPAQPAKPTAKELAQQKAEQQKKAAEADAFQKRMEKMEQEAAAREFDQRVAALKNKGGSTRTGMPGAKGTEAGSDYSSYVQSRLKDALREVMVSQTASPQLIATITVGTDGRIAEYKVEKGSGDPLFDDAVRRAVALAGKRLVPPPGGAPFKGVFRFKPEGVGVR